MATNCKVTYAELLCSYTHIHTQVEGFQYWCVIDKILLSAIYQNKTLTTCIVGNGDVRFIPYVITFNKLVSICLFQLTLPATLGSSFVEITLICTGNRISETIDSLMKQTEGDYNKLGFWFHIKISHFGTVRELLYVNNFLFNSDFLSVELYDCQIMADDCSPCLASRLDAGFRCGWCDTSCEMEAECSNISTFITSGSNCPAPVVTSILPASGMA